MHTKRHHSVLDQWKIVRLIRLCGVDKRYILLRKTKYINLIAKIFWNPSQLHVDAYGMSMY